MAGEIVIWITSCITAIPRGELIVTALPSAVAVKAEARGGRNLCTFSENWNWICSPPPVTVALVSVGGVVSGAAATAAVATLVSVSALLASSVKLTFTLIVVPWSSVTSV